MSNFPKISVVMSNYNGLKYLKETILPILKLDYPNFEFIIIDNGSIDGSIQYIEEFKNIILVKNKLIGSKNAGLNLAIEKTKGDYILFLDNDVLIIDKFLLRSLINEYQVLKNIGIITLALVNKGESNIYFYGSYLSRISFIKKNIRIPLNEVEKINRKLVVGVQGASFFIKKNIFDNLGKFDEVIPFGGEDVDLGLRSILAGFKNYIYSKSLAVHLGMFERINNDKYLAKLVFNTAGLYMTIIKNYTFINVILSLLAFIPYQFIKSIKDSFERKEPRILISYFSSFKIIVFNLRSLINMRSRIQKSRKIRTDSFFEIRLISNNTNCL